MQNIRGRAFPYITPHPCPVYIPKDSIICTLPITKAIICVFSFKYLGGCLNHLPFKGLIDNLINCPIVSFMSMAQVEACLRQWFIQISPHSSLSTRAKRWKWIGGANSSLFQSLSFGHRRYYFLSINWEEGQRTIGVSIE